MKTATAVMEENHQKGNANAASKNVGSFVKIDSISIDLDDANDKSYAGNCEHFSIRGYVSEVRKQNWKLCWPFAIDDVQNKFKEQKSSLPPLTAPKFRWWSCQNCLQEISSKGTAKDYGTGINFCSIGSQSNGTCSQMPSLSNPAMHLPDFHQAPKKPNIVEKRKVDVHTSTDVNWNNMHQLPLHSDKNEVLVADAHTAVIGNRNGLENDVGHEIPKLTFVPEEINSNVMQEKTKYDTDVEALKLERNRPAEPCEHSSRNHEVTNVELATHMGMFKNLTKMYQTVKQNSAEEQQKELKIASETSVLACSNDEAGNDVKVQADGYDPRVLDEFDNASSESVEILVGNNLHDHNHDMSSGSQRRKTRKVRLLTELLCDNGDAKIDHISTEDSPLNANNSASAEVAVVSAFQGDQVSLQDNCREGLGDNKKRKLPQDEELRSPEMSSLYNINNKVKNLKGGEETANAVADSELEKDASAGPYLQTGTESYCTGYTIDRTPINVKKKNKKNQIVDVRPPLVPTGEKLPNQIPGEAGISGKGTVDDVTSFGLIKDACTVRELDKIPMEASRKEKKSSLIKKKSKMPKVDDGQALQNPWNSSFLKKGLTMKNEEIMQSGPVTVSFQQAEDASPEKGHLSFNSRLASQRYNRKYTQLEDGLPSMLSCQDGTPVEEIRKKNVETSYIPDSRIPSKSASYSLFKKRVHSELSSKLATYNMPVLKEKQTYSKVEEGCCSLVKQVDISSASNCQKTIKGKEHSVVTRKPADKVADKVSDNGAFDDIPMEIVELMAKNQYERRLDNAEAKKCLLGTADEKRKSQMMDNNKIHGTKEFRIFEETNQRRNPRGKNGKNDITRGKNDRLTRQKSVDYFSHVNRNQFNISHLGQKKSSSSVQFPAIGSGQCSCAQNCKWNGDMVDHGFYNASMQIGACDTCQIVSQPREEAAHLWSSTVPVNMPLRYKVPPKGVSQPTNLDVLSKCTGLLHKGNKIDREHEQKILNPNAANLENHNQDIGSENFSRRNAEYPFAKKHNGIDLQQNLVGPLDPYSNETIPAMHLLSLMDAGMQSGTTFNTGGNSKFLKRVSPSDHNSKEYSLMEFGVYSKLSDTVKHPLDYYGKNQVPEQSHDFFSVNPTIGPSTSSFHTKGFGKPNDFAGQVSFSSRRKEKVQSSGSPAQNRGRRPITSMFAGSSGLGTNDNAIPVHSMQKGVLGASGSMVHPLQLYTRETSTELTLETPHISGTFWPPKSSSESAICSINRNPADFSMPEAGNEFMIRGEDLKFRFLRKRSGLISVNQRKRQRNAKRATEKDCMALNFMRGS